MGLRVGQYRCRSAALDAGIDQRMPHQQFSILGQTECHDRIRFGLLMITDMRKGSKPLDHTGIFGHQDLLTDCGQACIKARQAGQ
jgi:hypothetical protein